MCTDHHSIQLTNANGTKLNLDQMEDSIGMDNISLHLMADDNDSEEKIDTDGFIGYKQLTKKNSFISRMIKELKHCVNNSYSKRLLLILTFISLLTFFRLFIIVSLFPLPKPQNTIKTNVIWHQNEIIYEINVLMFYDSNQDGIGDLKGIIEKLEYLQKNNIQSILLQSSIFNVSYDLFEILNRQYAKTQTKDLLKLDPHIGTEEDFRDFMKVLTNRNMHLIVDLPLSSSSDHKDLSWYGSATSSSSIKIQNPCLHHKNDLGCNYYKLYKRLPLNFSNQDIANAAESRLRYWLLEKNVDGVRVDLPLTYDHLTNTYHISFKTINRWKIITEQIETKTKPKLLLFDIPFHLQNIIHNQSFNEQHSTCLLNFIEKERLSNTKYSVEQNKAFSQRFWQFGMGREHFRLGMMHDVSQRISFAIGMLIGGTPIVLYGDELGIKQGNGPWMSWTSDPPYGGFSSCLSEKCNETLSSYDVDFVKANVKNQEGTNDIENNNSLLIFFRRLSKLRKHESFQFGSLIKGYHSLSDILWFIREAPDYRGFIIVIRYVSYNDEPLYIPLRNLTNQQIPNQIYYGYQSTKVDLSPSDSSLIDSDRLLIYPGSINIFWWPPKLS